MQSFDAVTANAIAMFRYREEATKRTLPCDPDWHTVMGKSFKPALAGERGKTDQEQCVYQAIRLALWESGAIQAPWTKAFLPLPTPPLVWYRRWWGKVTAWGRSLVKRFNDYL